MAKAKTSSSAKIAAQPLLRLQNVNKEYKIGKTAVQVLKNINLDIYPEEFILIFGPSGSGKSTLLNHFLGLEHPTTGSVTVHGRSLAGISDNDMARLRYTYFGIVFQRPDWVNSINVVQNVAVPLAIHNVGRHERLDRANRYLQQLGIADHATYNPNDLSGGEQQKVALARAIINDPDIIIADEPTGNLDTESAKRVMDIFQELHQKHHKTIVLVTHNFEYLHYGTRLLNLRDGSISGADASSTTVV